MKISLAFILLCSPLLLFAQIDQHIADYWISQWNMNEDQELDIDYNSELEHYFQHKLNINDMRIDALAASPFFNEQQVNEIILYRNQYQQFMSVYELRQIQSLSDDMLLHLLPFLELIEASEVMEPSQTLKLQIKAAQPKAVGYTNRIYNGNIIYANTQYMYQSKQCSFGFRMEKDPAEKTFNASEFPFLDFSTAFISFNNIGRFEKIILGDFGFSAGQGLCISTNSFIGNSSGLELIKRTSRGLEPYKSNRENNALRGIGFSLPFGSFQLNAFYSTIQNDASKNDNGEIRSLNEGSGTHRTASEIASYNALEEKLVGIAISYHTNTLDLGWLLIHKKLSSSLEQSSQVYKLFYLHANSYQKQSLFYEYRRKNHIFYGEYCIDHRLKSAIVQGLSSSYGRHLDMSILYRKYQSGFISYQATPFSRSSNFGGEEGLYVSLRLTLKPLLINMYLDRYRNNWLRFATDGLSLLQKKGLNIVYQKTKSLKLNLRYIHSVQPSQSTIGRHWDLNYSNKQQLRLQLNYQVSKQLEWRYRFQLNGLDQRNSYLIYSEMIKDFSIGSISIRMTKTEISKAFISAIERSAPGMYPYILHSKSSFSYYVLIKFVASSKLKCWFKFSNYMYYFATTTFEQVNNIGSGNDEIIGDRKNNFALQISYTIK